MTANYKGEDWLGLAPWAARVEVKIAETPERAVQDEKSWRPGLTWYTDTSVRNRVCGIGVTGQGIPISITVGR
jgi:hypothetical protein